MSVLYILRGDIYIYIAVSFPHKRSQQTHTNARAHTWWCFAATGTVVAFVFVAYMSFTIFDLKFQHNFVLFSASPFCFWFVFLDIQFVTVTGRTTFCLNAHKHVAAREKNEENNNRTMKALWNDLQVENSSRSAKQRCNKQVARERKKNNNEKTNPFLLEVLSVDVVSLGVQTNSGERGKQTEENWWKRRRGRRRCCNVCAFKLIDLQFVQLGSLTISILLLSSFTAVALLLSSTTIIIGIIWLCYFYRCGSLVLVFFPTVFLVVWCSTALLLLLLLLLLLTNKTIAYTYTVWTMMESTFKCQMHNRWFSFLSALCVSVSLSVLAGSDFMLLIIFSCLWPIDFEYTSPLSQCVSFSTSLFLPLSLSFTWVSLMVHKQQVSGLSPLAKKKQQQQQLIDAEQSEKH